MKNANQPTEQFSISSRDIMILRYSMALIYFWFGALKLQGSAHVDDLLMRTIVEIVPLKLVPLLGIWEIAIGICFAIPNLVPAALVLFIFHIPGTMLPLLLVQHNTFVMFPIIPTLVGQYIIKNVVLISAVAVIARYTLAQKPVLASRVIQFRTQFSTAFTCVLGFVLFFRK